MEQQQIEQVVHDLAVKHLCIERSKIKNDVSIVKDLGADSLDVVAFVIGVEKTFGKSITDDQAEAISTLNDVIALVSKPGNA